MGAAAGAEAEDVELSATTGAEGAAGLTAGFAVVCTAADAGTAAEDGAAVEG